MAAPQLQARLIFYKKKETSNKEANVHGLNAQAEPARCRPSHWQSNWPPMGPEEVGQATHKDKGTEGTLGKELGVAQA